MKRARLQEILGQEFDQAVWLDVVRSVFGATHGLLAQPKDITGQLKGARTDVATAAHELGSFTTSDGYVVGLYQVEVKPNVWLERNKVGLRHLLRDVYRYDVDAAIIVFVQEQTWRLSFVSEIKVLNDEGEVIEQVTEPKRYTYLLGDGQTVRTPAERLAPLAGKELAIQDILNAFSVEALNEEFYKSIQAFFYRLVGGEVGKGRKKTHYGEGVLQLPGVPKTNRTTYQEFAVRLIGRTVFCWFLKMKAAEDGESLLPESLLSSQAVAKNDMYYHTVLERVFFQVLNTPMDHRVDTLPAGAEQIPFLNGGLFEPGPGDHYTPNRQTGLSEHLNTLTVPNDWFQELFDELEKNNLTIDENSVTDVEVSVDPEMLGRIFENLLAEIDPDTEKTARKATGSFYTPREIVDYMATESLVQYLHNKTGIEHEMLRPLFKMLEAKDPDYTVAERERILDALDTVKILDPACGSGAFPMGVLQKIVQALQKLDPDATWWKKRQVDRIRNAVVKKQLREKLESSGVEYARKIGIIQNSLYGVDIQPVAAEISKLRCFLTLIVDEHIDESRPNRGIEPLPNLEFKFVTADTLIMLPDETDMGGLFNANEQLDELDRIRQDYLQSFGEEKIHLKDEFERIQGAITDQQIRDAAQRTGEPVDLNSRAWRIGTWKPFGHDKSDWFDPKWMFGVERFDVVIGNPPYFVYEGPNARSIELIRSLEFYRPAFSGKLNAYKLFIIRSLSLLKDDGVLVQIVQNSFLADASANSLRRLILEESRLIAIDSYPERDSPSKRVFPGVKMSVCIVKIQRSSPGEQFLLRIWAEREMKNSKNIHFSPNQILEFDERNCAIPLLNEEERRVFNIVFNRDNFETLGSLVRCYRGELNMTTDRQYFTSDSSYPMALKGAQVQPYRVSNTLSQGDVEYVLVDLYLEQRRGSRRDHYLSNRVVTQRITGVNEKIRLKAAVSDEGVFCADSCNYLMGTTELSVYLLCGLLNSSVLNWAFRKFSTNSNVNSYEVHNLPIPRRRNNADLIDILSRMVMDSEICEFRHSEGLIKVIDWLVLEMYFANAEEVVDGSLGKLVHKDLEREMGESDYVNLSLDERRQLAKRLADLWLSDDGIVSKRLAARVFDINECFNNILSM